MVGAPPPLGTRVLVSLLVLSSVCQSSPGTLPGLEAARGAGEAAEAKDPSSPGARYRPMTDFMVTPRYFSVSDLVKAMVLDYRHNYTSSYHQTNIDKHTPDNVDEGIEHSKIQQDETSQSPNSTEFRNYHHLDETNNTNVVHHPHHDVMEILIRQHELHQHHQQDEGPTHHHTHHKSFESAEQSDQQVEDDNENKKKDNPIHQVEQEQKREDGGEVTHQHELQESNNGQKQQLNYKLPQLREVK